MINKLLNIKYPIIQGGMANIATGKFAAAVSNAGGLGIIAAGALTKEELKKEIATCKSLTTNPFGINVMLMSPHVDEIMDLIIEEDIKVVTTGAGSPGKYIPKLKEHNVLVIPVVPSVALAKRMEKMGADALIVEGMEAGGHVSEQTTMALLPQVKDNVNIPIIAAGGIGDARGFVASLALGASGIQIGTVLLASEECPIHQNYKEAVLKAKDTDTVITGRSLNAPVRILKNKMARSYLELEKEAKDRMELEKLTLGGLKRAVFEGDVENGSVMMGQIAGLVKEIRPVKAILEDIYGKANIVMKEIEEKLNDAK